MRNWPQYKYRGDGIAPTQPAPEAYTTTEPYKPSAELIKAVNLSILLGRPLLLEGEAGSGKSRLARAVAYELGLPLKVWSVRSTSKAIEGLYRFDPLLRLHDVQAIQAGVDPTSMPRNPANPKDYRALNALGWAFTYHNTPTVVLIDEIDKADIDFPNDLLEVLEDWEFSIPDTGETIKAGPRPIIIITSNKEKGHLPAPFLRRCVYFFLRFPSTLEELKAIVELHYNRKNDHAEEIPLDDKLITTAIDRFRAIRSTNLAKYPGTSELLDWIKALHQFEDRPYMQDKLAKDQTLPYSEVLYKLRIDLPPSNHPSHAA